jgi:hypothetical protein
MKNPREVIRSHWGVFMLKRKAERLPFMVTHGEPGWSTHGRSHHLTPYPFGRYPL